MTTVVRLAAALVASVALALPASASAETLLPPSGQVFAGLTGGYDTAGFERQTGSHPAVFQFFSGFGGSLEYIFRGAAAGRSRLAIHISTDSGGREVITPKGIATGAGDAFLIKLADRIALSGAPAYIRLMSEMNCYWNKYSAYLANGRPRGSAYTTTWYKRAWRRAVIVMRGGPVADVNRRLRALRLRPVVTDRTELAAPVVSFMWVPQVAGAPDTRGNSPRAYWPGRRYVDWVGTDFYSKFPNFAGLERFYRQFRRKPFVFAEWAIWGRDDPAFVQRLFAWARSHGRVRMMLYNQGVREDGPFRLHRYPRARAALAAELRSPRFSDFAAEYRR
jgi:hypothetical protein